jgi:hypothetical protein
MAKKYRAVKFGGDDCYSWAVFYAKDIKGLRSPISEYTNAKPIVSGCGNQEAKSYVKQFEERDAKKA